VTRFRFQANTAADSWTFAGFPAKVLDLWSGHGLLGDVHWAAIGHDADPRRFTLAGGA
jgi:hypothetical protein